MSHAAVYSEVWFSFVVVLTLLLVIFIGVVVRTPSGTAGSPQPPEFSAPAPPPPPRPLSVRWPEAVVSAGAGGDPRVGYRPRHAVALKPELMVAGRLRVPGGPPWDPAPKPPGLAARSTVPWLAVPGQVPRKAGACRGLPPGPGPAPHSGSMSWAADMTDRAGAHRQARRHGAHRAGISTGREHRSAGRAGRHRAGVH